MRVQLTPRRAATFGQDFLAERINRRLNVTPLVAGENGEFSLSDLAKDARLVISHNPENAGEARLLAALPTQVKSVVHRHVQWGYLDESQQANLRASMEHAALCITPAAFLAEDSRARFPHVPCETVLIGRDPHTYRPTSHSERSDFRMDLGLPGNAFLAIHVGRLEPAKGAQILAALAARLPNRVALLVQFTANSDDPSQDSGFWPQARVLQAARPSQVHLWPDTNPQSDRPVRYADLLISASLSEAAPMVAVEALMSGVPILTTDSTPFYGELQTRGVDASDLTVVPLPFASRIAGLSRNQLLLTDEEASEAARRLATFLEEEKDAAMPRGDINRARCAAQMSHLGFTEDFMVNRLNILYDSAAASTSV